MILMPVRLYALQNTFKCLMSTGYYLLAMQDNNYMFVTEVTADDIGIYYFIPALARFFGLTLDVSIDYFFYGMFMLGVFMGLLGCYLLSKQLQIVFYVIVSFLLLFREGFFRLSDTYLSNVFCVLFIVPFSLWVVRNGKNLKFLYITVWVFLSGLIMGYCHYIRLYSSLAVFVFMILLIGLYGNMNKKRKYILLLAMFFGLFFSRVHMKFIIHSTEKFISEQRGFVSTVPCKHSFWHNIYAGLGFLENNYLGIIYSDRASFERSQKIQPGVKIHSLEYEHVLKKEVLRIVLKERLFIGMTLFAKFGVVIFFIIACSNIGLIAAYFYPKGILEYIFLVSVAISALSGVAVVPRVSYLSGLTTLSFVYGIYSIIYALKIRKNMKMELEHKEKVIK